MVRLLKGAKICREDILEAVERFQKAYGKQ